MNAHRSRIAVAGAAALVASLGLGSVGHAQAEPAPPDRSEAIARAQAALKGHPAAAKAAAQDTFTVSRVVIDDSGRSHVRYDRTHHGLPVLGGDFVVHNTAGGGYGGITVQIDQPVSVNTKPSIPPAAARTAAEQHAQADGGTVTKTGTPRLVVEAGQSKEGAHLAWETVVTGRKADGQTPSALHVLTDAHNGTVLDAFDEVMGGSGDGVHVGSVTIDTTKSASAWELKDPSHGNGSTCDLNNGTFSCAKMTDADNAWGNGDPRNDQSAAVDAHFGAAKTFDYFKQVHGRNGIFDDGRGVPSRVHYGDEYVNAFWNGSSMTYGDGADNLNPLTSLDVAGHEMSHGVTENTADLRYSGESGGLNESTSDIFGTMVEFHANISADKPDFLIGEKINIRGDGKPLRYMDEPSKDGKSYDCWESGIGNADVHHSSGVGNHFFFLLAQGSGSTEYGTSPTCDNSSVTGIGRDKAAAIWFKALDAYFGQSTDYHQARTDTLSAARDLYGQSSPEYQAVDRAWAAVNVS